MTLFSLNIYNNTIQNNTIEKYINVLGFFIVILFLLEVLCLD